MTVTLSSAVCQGLGIGADISKSGGKAMDEAINESIVIRKLTHWGLWKMSSGVSLGFRKEVNFMRLTVDNTPRLDSHNPAYDAECVQTNDAVETLPWLHQLVLRIEFLSTAGSVAEKAHRFGTSKRTFEMYRRDAYHLVANILTARLTSLRTDDINVLHQ